MSADFSASFDCRATAAVLRSGASAAFLGHAAATLTVGILALRGPWMLAVCAIPLWCALSYLSVRVKIDAAFFELLANHPAEDLDEWLTTTGLRGKTPPRSLAQRRTGALRLWRALTVVAGLQVIQLCVAIFLLEPRRIPAWLA